MGDLRDALSRNNRKLPDLAGPREFFGGDRLLQADRELAERLDGVYRRGEIYLRGLQRLSSLAFGTRTGRFLTRYLALPYGGTAVILEGLQHVVGPISEAITGTRSTSSIEPASLAVGGTLALGLIASRDFRTTLGRWLRQCIGSGATWWWACRPGSSGRAGPPAPGEPGVRLRLPRGDPPGAPGLAGLAGPPPVRGGRPGAGALGAGLPGHAACC